MVTHRIFGSSGFVSTLVLAGGCLALALHTTMASASVVTNNGSFDFGAVTNLYNTGTNSSGSVLSNGTSPAPYYTLVSAPAGQGTSLEVFSSSSYPGNAWVQPDAYSAWIAPVSGAAYTGSPVTYGLPGDYTYQMTFDSVAAGVITMSGQWATDNSSDAMEINNDGEVSITPTSGYSAFSPFTITGNVVAGANTLDFFVVNLTTSRNTDGANPTGLRVEFTGASLPSPGVGPLAFVGSLALIGGMVLRRRLATTKL